MAGRSKNKMKPLLDMSPLGWIDPGEEPAIIRIVRKYGGQKEFARILRKNPRIRQKGFGLSQQAVSLWCKQGFVPYDRIEEVAGLGGVAPHEVAPPEIRGLILSPGTRR